MDGAKFDPGAFNSSILPKKYDGLRDEYDARFEDIATLPPVRLTTLLCRIRPGIIDRALEISHTTFKSAARRMTIGVNTLRGARYGQMIMAQNASKLARVILALSDTSNRREFNIVRQPHVSLYRELMWGKHERISLEDARNYDDRMKANFDRIVAETYAQHRLDLGEDLSRE